MPTTTNTPSATTPSATVAAQTKLTVSAAMDALDLKSLLLAGTRKDLLKNQVVLIQDLRNCHTLGTAAEKVDEARLDEILARVPDVDPIPGDEL